MSSITEVVLRDIGRIGESFVSNISGPSRVLEHLSEQVRAGGNLIVPFSVDGFPEGVSLSAIDGGNASEMLSGGDLIVCGATLGEGVRSSRVWVDGDEPVEVWANVLPHVSGNDLVEKSVRALLELRVLWAAKTDVRVIDGAYLGNVSQVLYGLINRDVRVVNVLLEAVLQWGDGGLWLVEIFNEVLHPDRFKDNLILGVPKSDSSSRFVGEILREYGLAGSGFTDRVFAGRVLLPGELLAPRRLETNMPLVSSLERALNSDGFGEDVFDKPLLMRLLGDKAGLLRRLGQGPTELGLLWTTYFKPSSWGKLDGVIRIEFLYHEDENVLSATEKAVELVKLLDGDIVGSSIQEPWSQYHADRRAKDVSTAINVLKSYLVEQAESTVDVMGLIRKYRT